MIRPTASEAGKIRRLPVSLVRGSLNTIFGQLTFGASVFVLFLSELGLSKTNIGFLKSLLPFAGILAPFIAPAVRSFGYRRTFMVFYGARKWVLAGLVFAPLLSNRLSSAGLLTVVAIVVGTFALFRAIAETAMYPWQREYVPDSVRGKFTAASEVASTFSGILATALASAIIGSSSSLDRYVVLILLGCGLGFIGVMLSIFVPCGEPRPREGLDSHRRNLASAIGDARFRVFLTGLSFVTVAAMPLMSFVPLYMRERIGLLSGQVVFLDTGLMAGGLIFSFLWGWTADRYGSKSVLTVVLALFCTLPLAWLALPLTGDLVPVLAFCISLLFGACQVGFYIGSTHLLYNTIVPPNQEGSYLPVYYAWLGLTGGIGPLIAGWMIDRTGSRWSILFIACFVMLAIGLMVFRSIRYGQVSRTRDVLRLFVYGNPLSAFGLTIRYGGMLRQEQRLDAAVRMGQNRSPVHAEELLEMLEDPAFPVRYEAVVSAGRAPSDKRIRQALILLLSDPSRTIREAATWSLGRSGAVDAIPSLRTLYRSDDPIRYIAARSLGVLGDGVMLSEFITALEEASDHEQVSALGSALGSLRASCAVPELLRHLDAAPGMSRIALELTLAIARIVSVEPIFIKLWRRASRGHRIAREAGGDGAKDVDGLTDGDGARVMLDPDDVCQSVAATFLAHRRVLIASIGEQPASDVLDRFSDGDLRGGCSELARSIRAFMVENTEETSGDGAETDDPAGGDGSGGDGAHRKRAISTILSYCAAHLSDGNEVVLLLSASVIARPHR